MSKKVLKKEVWSKKSYYEKAKEGSLDFTHHAMKKLSELVENSDSILDMGCGEGTRLSKLISGEKEGYGIDISGKAIEMAKSKYSKLDFRTGDLENLPFPDEKFDLVYSAFVFEHLDNPSKVLKEGVRVLKKGGAILIVAPNFGAPNRSSPPYKGNRLQKLIKGFVKDFSGDSSLDWQRVEPIANLKEYEIDWDTTIEPYLGSLVKYIKSLGMVLEWTSSCWEKEDKNAGFMQKILKLLGESGIYPFKNWGPHLVLVAKKC